ncbi:hypothetical protein NDN13_01350 [Acinetobacter sp. C32I]|uniref:hypothetical protein n=1 Tax=Acinetobacter sp. C32I TaxID=2950074 RepID=UPI002037067C|nr:hypothetical protein [Acinetobacter sp. C32I]USA53866.1 hypothetical protein NDN13_01350 [Acinetobacter sp. C32I]
MADVLGGDRFERYLDELAKRLEQDATLRVGFLETETYPEDGLPVAQVAFWNEYGPTINVPESKTTIYRSIRKDGTFNKNGKFVRKSQSNFATEHTVPAHQVVIPPRPFFRSMIEKNKSGWSLAFGNLMKIHNGDVPKVFALMGEGIKDQLTQSIVEFSDPPNAPSTVRKKGFNKPLVETGTMQRATGWDIE